MQARLSAQRSVSSARSRLTRRRPTSGLLRIFCVEQKSQVNLEGPPVEAQRWELQFNAQGI
jgi:hypothetical protein